MLNSIGQDDEAPVLAAIQQPTGNPSASARGFPVCPAALPGRKLTFDRACLRFDHSREIFVAH